MRDKNTRNYSRRGSLSLVFLVFSYFFSRELRIEFRKEKKRDFETQRQLCVDTRRTSYFSSIFACFSVTWRAADAPFFPFLSQHLPWLNRIDIFPPPWANTLNLLSLSCLKISIVSLLFQYIEKIFRIFQIPPCSRKIPSRRHSVSVNYNYVHNALRGNVW